MMTLVLMDYADLDNHIALFDELLGPSQAENRETRFDYQVGRDSRPDSLRPGREFLMVMITTRNAYFNPVKFSWFYHSVPDRSGWFMTSLSLRGMALSWINTSLIDQLAELEYLDLQGNELSSFDYSSYTEKPFLHTLNLSGNLIEVLPNGLGDTFPALRVINLHDNRLKRFQMRNLLPVVELTRLTLSSNQLVEFDLEMIADFSYLKEVDVSDNSIESFDYELYNPRLSRLLLQNNHLSAFRLAGYLGELRYLAIYENNISTIDWRQLDLVLPNIERIHIWGNQLTELNLGQLSDGFDNLNELNVSGNQISTVDLTDNCSNLELLDLSCNQLTSLDLQQLPQSLKQLYLQYNPLKSITLVELPELELINLYGTRLQQIHITFTHTVEVDETYPQGQIISSGCTKIIIPSTTKILPN